MRGRWLNIENKQSAQAIAGGACNPKNVPIGITLGLLLAGITMSLSGCGGGGGDGGGGGPTPAPSAQVVSGSVQAPGGQVTLFIQPSLWERAAGVFSSEAVAALSGLSPVPDGTPVQLIRINEAGNVLATLASTTVSGGRYSFNLTSLGLSPASNLVVRVINLGTGVQLRAFVTGTTVDLDPIAETAVRLVLDHIILTPGTTLNQFTVTELRDIAGAVHQLATVRQLAGGLNIEATVSAIQTAVASETGLTAFIVSAAGPGETTEGPGDIGNFFPLTQGNTWKFEGTHAETGQPTTQFSNTMTVNGTNPVGTVMTTVLAESNPLNSGVAEEDYSLKDSRGVLNYGNNDPADTLSPKLIPYRDLLFPLNVGVTSEVVNKTGVDFGQDLDLPPDGKNETANVLLQVTVEKFEDVTVPKGTFSNVVKIVQKATLSVFSSSGFGSATVVSTQTVWFAPGVGPVKRTIEIQDVTNQVTESSTEELVDVFTAKQISLTTNDIIYDPDTQRIYASIPGSPGSIRSIDPATGNIGPQIPVGNEPFKLALSNNGQFLYVGLDGEAAVQRVDLTTQTTGAKFSLGSDSFFGPYNVEDIEVLPGSPGSVAVSRKYKGTTPKHAGVAIYDNGVQRPDVTPAHTGSNVIEFSSSDGTLYGYNNETTEFGFRRMAVVSSGVSITDTTPNLINNPADIKFDNGLIFASTGPIIDPVSLTRTGTFSVSPGSNLNETLVKPDSITLRVFFYQRDDVSAQATGKLLAFDRGTLQLLGSFDVENVAGKASSLIRWGAKGLAFRTDSGQVFIIESSKLIP